MKIYLIYDTDGLYAVTDKKELRNLFKHQRNDTFSFKCIKVSKNEMTDLFRKYSNKRLSKTTIGNLDLVCTVREIDNVYSHADGYDAKIDTAAEKVFEKLKMDESTKKALKYLTDTFTYKRHEDGTCDLISKINVFRIFCSLYGNTMKGE